MAQPVTEVLCASCGEPIVPGEQFVAVSELSLTLGQPTLQWAGGIHIKCPKPDEDTVDINPLMTRDGPKQDFHTNVDYSKKRLVDEVRVLPGWGPMLSVGITTPRDHWVHVVPADQPGWEHLRISQTEWKTYPLGWPIEFKSPWDDVLGGRCLTHWGCPACGTSVEVKNFATSHLKNGPPKAVECSQCQAVFDHAGECEPYDGGGTSRVRWCYTHRELTQDNIGVDPETGHYEHGHVTDAKESGLL